MHIKILCLFQMEYDQREKESIQIKFNVAPLSRVWEKYEGMLCPTWLPSSKTRQINIHQLAGLKQTD